MRAPDIHCPYCGTKMEPGVVFVRGTLLGFLAVGFSHQHLWFDAGAGREVALRTSDQRAFQQISANTLESALRFTSFGPA